MNLFSKTCRVLIMMAAALAVTRGLDAVAEQASPATIMLQMSGKVLSVDPQRRMLLVESKQRIGTSPATQRIDFVLDQQTVITEGVKRLQPAELEVGEQVQVEYTLRDGKKLARSITVQQPGGASSPAGANTSTPSQSDPSPSAAPQ